MNRHERRAHAAQNRSRVSAWNAGAPGEIHVAGGYDEAVNLAGGEESVVTVVAKLGNATVKAAIPLDKIDETLELMRNVAAEQGKGVDPRQCAMTFVIDAMKKSQHLTQPTGSSVVATLFWLACTRRGMEDEVLRRAREGGHLISWTITEGGPGFGNNWRLSLDALPEDSADLPVPKHPKISQPLWTSGRR
jgi:hypothetical protein